MINISVILPIYTIILILIGLGYTISYSINFSEKSTHDKVLGVLIGISTFSALILWSISYLPMFLAKKTSYQNLTRPLNLAPQTNYNLNTPIRPQMPPYQQQLPPYR